MEKAYILRYGELALKGKNRLEFEHRLIFNIRDCLKKNNIDAKIFRTNGRFIIKSDKDCSLLKNVFGLISISPAIVTKNSLDSIKDIVKKSFPKIKGKSFIIPPLIFCK